MRSLDVKEPKTKLVKSKLKEFDLPGSVLIVSDEVEENLYLAARNIPRVEVRDVVGADPVSLIAHEKVLITVSALKKFEEMLG